MLKQDYLNTILADQELQGKIAKAAGRSVQTVILWAKNNSSFLTMKKVLIELTDYLGVSEEELLAPTTTAAH